MIRRSLPPVVPLSTLVGTAAWCSRGVMEVVPGPEGDVRLALLRPLFTWLPTVLLVLAVLWAWLRVVTRWRRRRVARAGHPSRTREVAPTALLWPLYASGLMILPWLPVLPDVVRPLRLLAAPFGLLLWGVLLALALVNSLAWVLEPPPPAQASGDTTVAPRRPSRLAPWLVLAAGVLVFSLAAWRITGSPLSPSGDEPHYLVIAQSLWRDGDLRIEDNHNRGDYREYFDRDLKPHYLTRGKDGEIYSIHPVGLPVLLAPVYAAGAYRLVVFFLVVVGAATAALAWRLARQVSGSTEAATLAWIGIALSVPFVFNAFSVYPEIVGALLVLIAFGTGLPGEGRTHGRWRWWAAGLCLAALPWLATKYASMTLALAAVLALRAVRPRGSGTFTPAWTMLAAIAVPGVVSAAAWFSFFWWIWGSASPAAPYGAMLQTSPRYLGFGGPGLLFDQEYGLLTYAPVLLVGFAGVWQMWRHGGQPRRLALEASLVFLALVASVGAFRIWWGDAWPGRPVVAGLALWMLPVSWYVSRARAGGGRAWAWLLAATAVGITAIAVSAQEGLLVASTRDGLSRLLQWLGGLYALWTSAPSFIASHYGTALPVSLLWLAIFGVLTWWCGRGSGGDAAARGPGTLRAALAAPLGVVLAALLVPVVFGALQEKPRAGSYSRSAVLDGFSSTGYPVAVRYDPFTVSGADAALGQVRFVATPGLRTDPQPVPVLLNMRLSLPAGRYRVTAQLRDVPPGDRTVALRLGRVGPAYQVYELPASGASWTQEFDVPVDANFVGFEASRAVAAVVRRLDVTPVSVVDAGRRVAVGQVLSAQAYPAAHLFSHDEQSWVEQEGAWTAARRTASFTVVPRRDGPLVVRLRNGPVPNVAVLAGKGWQRRVALDAGEVSDVELPPVEAGRALALRVTTEQGFVPNDHDPSTGDRRLLGVFLRFP